MSEQSKMTNEEAFEKWFENTVLNDNIHDVAQWAWQAAIAYMQEQNKSAENSEPVAYLKFYSHEYGLDRWEGFEEVSKNTDGAFPVYTTPQISQEQSEPVGRVEHREDTTQYGILYTHLPRGTELFTTPQRQQPLKRLDNYDLSEILDEYWYEPLKIALTVMDEMERINK